MSLPQGTWYTFDYRPPIKAHTRDNISNILGMYIFVTIGMLGQVWVMTKIDEHSMIVKPFIWGIAYACGMFVSGGYSGASFHPGVTFGYTMTSKGEISYRKTWFTILIDVFSALMAAATVALLTYYELLVHFGEDFKTDGSAREMYLQEYNPDSNFLETFADGFLSAFFYALILAGLTDNKNHGIDRCWQPVYTAIDVTIVGLAFGYAHGSTVNPFIDFVPRVVCSCVGFKHCWKPWYHVFLTLFTTCLGGMFGVLVYHWLLEDSVKERDHLVPHYGGKRPLKGRAKLKGRKPDPNEEVPYLVARKRENFKYLLDDEEDRTLDKGSNKPKAAKDLGNRY